MLNIRSLILTSAICISIFGLFIVLTFLVKPQIFHDTFFWRKPVIGSIFSLICVCGIVAALFPSQCSKYFQLEKKVNRVHTTPRKTYLNFKGHHPTCREFSTHIIHINNHTLCAACTGLLLGGFLALITTTLYFFCGWRIEGISFYSISLGVSSIAIGFFQLKFKGFFRLVLNTLFVLGAFLILSGIEELAKSLVIDLFLIVLVIFWLLTRILLSEWDHMRICASCRFQCKMKNWRSKKQGL